MLRIVDVIGAPVLFVQPDVEFPRGHHRMAGIAARVTRLLITEVLVAMPGSRVRVPLKSKLCEFVSEPAFGCQARFAEILRPERRNRLAQAATELTGDAVGQARASASRIPGAMTTSGWRAPQGVSRLKPHCSLTPNVRRVPVYARMSLSGISAFAMSWKSSPVQ